MLDVTPAPKERKDARSCLSERYPGIQEMGDKQISKENPDSGSKKNKCGTPEHLVLLLCHWDHFVSN